MPRYTLTQTDIIGPMLQIPDATSFMWMYYELFEREIYKFKAKTTRPHILDGGANIGLSVIYFKRMYPDARLIAFEPDPQMYRILQQNLQSAGVQDVELVNRALWTEETTLSFAPDGADAGHLVMASEETNLVKVQTVWLRNYLNVPVDFLKLDIEGAETTVLQDCHDKLTDVQNIFVEYHSYQNSPQTLDTVLTILKDSGFRIHVHANNPAHQPFVERKICAGMDLQVDIFGFRD